LGKGEQITALQITALAGEKPADLAGPPPAKHELVIKS
jgi:hypothetical protein